MLRYLLGASKTGKSRRVCEEIVRLSEAADSRIILLVPEQFTFETEKQLFRTLSGERFRHVNVTSFTRLAQEAFSRYGGGAGQYADDCAKHVMMERALDELRDGLSVYARSARGKGFAGDMLQAVAEFKNAGVEPEELDASAELLPEGALRDKLKETALIYGAYNALLLQTYLDPLDDISRAVRLLEGENGTAFFSSAHVFLDEFKGFTAGELGLLRLLLQKAEDVTVSLCLDRERAAQNPGSAFGSLLALYERLNRLARENGVPVAVPETLSTSYFSSPELAHMEQNLFAPIIAPYPGENKAVHAVLCKNEYREVDYVLATIRILLREEGFRCRDIAVITRDIEAYLPRLEAGFQKYGLPYFADYAAPVEKKPLIRFVQNALDCVCRGYGGENVLAMLKCGMTPVSVEEIAMLENYVYVWSISGARWREPFVANPRGFQESFTPEDAAALDRLEQLRGEVIGRLDGLREAMREAASARECCAALFRFLEETGVRERIELLIGEAYGQEDFAAAEEYGRVWDILMKLLDDIAAASGSRRVAPEQFARLFQLSAASYDMGVLPQAADTIIVGGADRIRTGDKRAVFVLGANENVLPYVPIGGGMFSDRERELLQTVDIEISRTTREKIREERFIAYKTLTSASERLYITARRADIAGNELAPSPLFAQLARMFGGQVLTDGELLDGEYYCQSPASAFSLLAERYLEDTELNASLKHVLRRDAEYAPKLAGLDRALEKRSFAISDRDTAVRLFGREMNLSPTRVESFYQCRFRYFMEQGVGAYPLRKADLDPLETGTLIHRILFEVTRRVDLKGEYDQKLVRELIKRELDRYIDTVMGGVQDKTNRFLYLYNRLRLSILKIVDQLHAELAQSGFTPCAFEMEIGAQGQAEPLRLEAEDGTVVNIAGKVDRVDVYQKKNGEKYVRIIDYKSGKKQFKLNDVLYGLNLQMLIYLQCISQNGKGELQNALPAGILYMPAGEQEAVLPREAGAAEVEGQKRRAYAMNGLLIEDRELLSAMDSGIQGVFIPVSTTKSGDFSKASLHSLVSLTQLSKINDYIDKLVIHMANELHAGKIEALPLEGSCAYCSYRAVCGVTRASKVREYLKQDREEVLEEIEKSGVSGLRKEDAADGEA